MSRYRKVSTELHGDDKFARLSPVKPSGQSLWIHLLIGPCRTNLPGLMARGEAGLAEELGWSLAAFRRCWAELEQARMAVEADWKGRVVFLPNAILHNAPESPNVIRSWRENFDLVPASPLKATALAVWREAIVTRLGDDRKGLGEGFRKAFLETFPEAYPEGFTEARPVTPEEASPKSMANQEQEQEQEQPSKAPRVRGASAGPGFEAWWTAYPNRPGGKGSRKACVSIWTRDGCEAKTGMILEALAAFTTCDQWRKEAGQFIPMAQTWLGQRRYEAPPASPPGADDDPPPGLRQPIKYRGAWMELADAQAQEARR